MVLGVMRVAGGGNLRQWLFHLLLHWLGPPAFASMMYSILYVGVCMLPVLLLCRNETFSRREMATTSPTSGVSPDAGSRYVRQSCTHAM